MKSNNIYPKEQKEDSIDCSLRKISSAPADNPYSKGCGSFLNKYHFGEKVRCGDFILGLHLCPECRGLEEAYEEGRKNALKKEFEFLANKIMHLWDLDAGAYKTQERIKKIKEELEQ